MFIIGVDFRKVFFDDSPRFGDVDLVFIFVKIGKIFIDDGPRLDIISLVFGWRCTIFVLVLGLVFVSLGSLTLFAAAFRPTIGFNVALLLAIVTLDVTFVFALVSLA